MPPVTPEKLAARWAWLAGLAHAPEHPVTLWRNWSVRGGPGFAGGAGAAVGLIDAEITGASRCTSFGYQFLAPHWGQGLATEACGAVIAALERDGVDVIHAAVTDGNTASMRVLLKLGFRRDRVLPGNDLIRGVPHDDVLFVRDSRR